MAQSWLAGLDETEREEFSKVTIGEFANNAEKLINQPFSKNIAESTIEEIACTNMVLCRKKEN